MSVQTSNDGIVGDVAGLSLVVEKATISLESHTSRTTIVGVSAALVSAVTAGFHGKNGATTCHGNASSQRARRDSLVWLARLSAVLL